MRCRSFIRYGYAFLCAAFAALAVSPASAELKLVTGNEPYSLNVMTYRDIPFRTIYRQQYDYSCGSASLATLLHFHYGENVNESEIFKDMFLAGDQASIQKVGFSLLDMKNYLARKGYVADGYRMSFDELIQNANPAIAVITSGPYRHFVVVKGVEKGRILIGDPALGLKIYTRAEFEKMWFNDIVFMIHGGKASKGLYNVTGEWQPFAPSPIPAARALDVNELYGLRVNIPVIYQIPQVTPP